MFILDMRSPGVEVRPLVVATGAAPFNEVFIDDVEVSNDALIGEVNDGWRVALSVLSHERVSLGAGTVRSKANPLRFDSLAALARSKGLLADERVAASLVQLYARQSALAAYGELLHEEDDAGMPVGPRGSVSKMASAQLDLWASRLAGDLAGEDAATGAEDASPVTWHYLQVPGHAISGGTIQIQKNIIGERILGLAKDPGSDRNVPFNARNGDSRM